MMSGRKRKRSDLKDTEFSNPASHAKKDFALDF